MKNLCLNIPKRALAFIASALMLINLSAFGINVTINVGDPTRGKVSVDGSPAAATFTADMLENTVITIKAIEESGFNFSLWSDGADANPRTLTLTQDTVITAIFDAAGVEYCITYYAKAVDKNGEGTIIPIIELTGISFEDCSPYEDNHKLFGGFKINPDTGYHFDRWLYGATEYKVVNPTVPLHHNENAVFVYGMNAYVVETYSNNEAWGKTLGDGVYYFEESVKLSAEDIPQHCHIVSWTDSVAKVNSLKEFEPLIDSVDSYSFTLDSKYGYIQKFPYNHMDTLRYYATFAPDSAILALQADPDTCGTIKLKYSLTTLTPNDYITPKDTFTADTARFQWDDKLNGYCTSVTLEAHAAKHYEFDHWTLDGVQLTEYTDVDTIISVDCPEDTVVYQAHFRPKKYVIEETHFYATEYDELTQEYKEPKLITTIYQDEVAYDSLARIGTVPDDCYEFNQWEYRETVLLKKVVADIDTLPLKINEDVVLFDKDTIRVNAFYLIRKFPVNFVSDDVTMGNISARIVSTNTEIFSGDKVVCGDTIEFAIKEEDCYELDSVRDNRLEQKYEGQTTVVVSDTIDVTVYFKDKYYEISVETDEVQQCEGPSQLKGKAFIWKVQGGIQISPTDSVQTVDSVLCGDFVKLYTYPRSAHDKFEKWDDELADNDKQERTVEINTPDIITSFRPIYKTDSFQVTLTAVLPDFTLIDESEITMNGNGKQEWQSCVTLEAVPIECYKFDRWQCFTDGAWVDVVADNPMQITVVSDTTFRAVMIKQYRLTLNADPVEAASMQGDGCYDAGETVEFTFVTNEGYNFKQWQDDPTADSVRTVVMDADKEFTALFDTEERTIVVTSNPVDAEIVTSGSGTYPFGSTQTISVTYDPNHFTFNGWDDDATAPDTRAITVTEDKTYTALLTPVDFHIEVTAGPNGTAGTTGDYPYHSTVDISATADHCYQFDAWQASGDAPDPNLNASSETTSVIVLGDAVYNATFKQGEYIVSVVTQPTAGMGTLTGTTSGLHCGDTYDVSFQPDACVSDWKWADTNDQAANKTGVIDGEDVVLYVNVELYSYTITVNTNNPAWGTATGGGTFDCGQSTTLEATANTGYRLEYWEKDGSKLTGSDNQTSLSVAIDADATYTAVFVEDTYTITVKINDANMGTILQPIPTTQTVPNGTEITLETEPKTRPSTQCQYEFQGWQIDGSVYSNDLLTTIVVDRDIVVTAVYSYTQHHILIKSNEPDWGDILVNTVNYGASHEVNIECGEGIWLDAASKNPIGYYFDHWTDGQSNYPQGQSLLLYTIGPDSPKEVVLTAVFERYQYTIDVQCDATKGTPFGGGTYYYGDYADIGIEALCGWQFDKWADSDTEPSSRSVLVTGNATYTATLKERLYSATVAASPAELGTVSAGATGLHCNDPFTFWVAYGDSVQFLGWNDGDMDTLRTISVEDDYNFVANLDIKHFTINTPYDPAAGTVTGGGTYRWGTEVTVVATPNPNYQFIGWEEVATTSNTITINNNKDITLTAKFVRVYNVNVTVSDPAGGTATGSGEYLDGETANINVTLNEGYEFVNWSDGSIEQNRSIIVDNDYSLVANIQIKKFTVTTPFDPAEGTVTGGGTYNWGTEVTVEATPNPNYIFTGWEEIPSTNPVVVIDNNQDITLTAKFVRVYNVTVVASDPTGGTVTGGGEFFYGDVTHIEATVNEGYEFLGWDNGVTTLLFDLTVTQDETITAIIKKKINIVAQPNDASRGTATGSGIYLDGDVAHLVATPNDGYEFYGWSDGYQYPVYDLNVTQDSTLVANFRLIPFTIYVVQNDTICDSDTYTLPSGKQVTISQTGLHYIDSTKYEIEQGVVCDRIYDITLVPLSALALPDITVLPKAYFNDTLYLAAADSAINESIEAQSTPFMPVVYDGYWELYSTEANDYVVYTKQTITDSVAVKVRYVMNTSCGQIMSDELTLQVLKSSSDNNDLCRKDADAMLLVSEDSLTLSIDRKAMHQLGYSFTDSDVTWYKVVDEIDMVDALDPDDQLLDSGYSINLALYNYESGQYYARISLPAQQDFVPCYGILRSPVFNYVSVDRDGWTLLPTIVQQGFNAVLSGLDPEQTTSVCVYSIVGALVEKHHVTESTFIELATSQYPVGTYAVRIECGKQRQTIKFAVVHK